MSKRRKPRPVATARPTTTPDGSVDTPNAVASGKWTRLLLIAGVFLVIAATGIWYWMSSMTSYPSATGIKSADSTVSAITAEHVGRDTCMTCHSDQDKAWKGSHHQLAMQEANAETVLGNFSNAKFRYNGVESTFFRRDDKFMVRTDGPDGRLADFEIKYTFGVTPLQQYLIEFPGGRQQALSIAWDARAVNEGGQRWYHLYPNDKIDHQDQLHWTGLYQNWNLQCASCHSTNLRKGYDPANNSYKTTFSEINVSCESCHGPGSRHVEWAKQAKAPFDAKDAKGLTVLLKSRWNEAWKFPENERIARRDTPAAPEAMNSCAACHARRSGISENGMPGAPLDDTHRLALLTAPNYHADGQQRDEVYTWGSFQQSKMFQAGVTCLDCHDPHALRLRAQGNALCLRCHSAAAFDSEKHHFHRADTKGAQCIGCHMPAQKYMGIDERRDHSFRVPRPDLATRLSTPNACTQCHADKKPEWAAAAMDQWYGPGWRERPHFGAILHAALSQGAKALPGLLDLAQNSGSPAIVRATAATLAQAHPRPTSLLAVRALLLDRSPMVRIAALGMLESFDPPVRAEHAVALLGDPVRGVRVEAARLVADVPDAQFPAEYRAGRTRALQEYEESLSQDADWPAANVNLGNLRMRQGRPNEAIAAYERAMALDAMFAGAYVNLADTYRQLGRDAEGEQILRRGLKLLPRAADLHHVLGLQLVRKGDQEAALTELAAAVKLAPESARYAYVYAIGLNSAGKREAALAVLNAAAVRQPFDLDILGALVSINRDAGNARAALPYARKLAEALPGDAGVTKLLAELEASGR